MLICSVLFFINSRQWRICTANHKQNWTLNSKEQKVLRRHSLSLSLFLYIYKPKMVLEKETNRMYLNSQIKNLLLLSRSKATTHVLRWVEKHWELSIVFWNNLDLSSQSIRCKQPLHKNVPLTSLLQSAVALELGWCGLLAFGANRSNSSVGVVLDCLAPSSLGWCIVPGFFPPTAFLRLCRYRLCWSLCLPPPAGRVALPPGSDTTGMTYTESWRRQRLSSGPKKPREWQRLTSWPAGDDSGCGRDQWCPGGNSDCGRVRRSPGDDTTCHQGGRCHCQPQAW